MLIEALAKEREALRKEMREEMREEVRKEVQKEERKEGRKEGRTEGRKEGKLEMIAQILQRRLGDMPPTVRDRLRRCTLTRLNTLVNPALDAATWEEFAAALPPIVSKA